MRQSFLNLWNRRESSFNSEFTEEAGFQRWLVRFITCDFAVPLSGWKYIPRSYQPALKAASLCDEFPLFPSRLCITFFLDVLEQLLPIIKHLHKETHLTTWCPLSSFSA